MVCLEGREGGGRGRKQLEVVGFVAAPHTFDTQTQTESAMHRVRGEGVEASSNLRPLQRRISDQRGNTSK